MTPRFLTPIHLWVLLVWATFALPISAQVASTAFMTGQEDLGQGIRYLEDPTGQLTLDDVRQRNDWGTNTKPTFSQGYSTSAWWLTVTLHNPQPQADWLLEIAAPILDHVDVYVDSAHTHYALGDKQPFAERPFPHHHFMVPLTLPQGSSTTLWIRLQTTSAIRAPLKLWDRTTFHSHQITPTVLHGIYFGGLLVIAVYNLLLFCIVGERTYFYYVGHISSVGLLLASIQGRSFQYLWPNATQWNDQSILLFLAGCTLFGVLFTHRYLASVHSLKSWMQWLFSVFLTATLFTTAGGLLAPYTPVLLVLIGVTLAWCLTGQIVSLQAYFERRPYALYYALAWGMLLLGTIIILMKNQGWLPSNVLTEHALMLGSLLEAMLLSFALAQRINHDRALRVLAQQQALETEREATRELEQQVQERTLALEQTHQQLLELSNTDQLTGLRNRRYLDQYLEEHHALAHTHGRPIAVLLIDIDHFKSVNDEHGHIVGDLCLQTVAEQLKHSAQGTHDLAARYGGEEFCFILPDTDADGARVVAERIRCRVARTPITAKSGTLRVTCSIGLFAAVPGSELTKTEFISRADAALYHAKENGRDRVSDFTEVR